MRAASVPEARLRHPNRETGPARQSVCPTQGQVGARGQATVQLDRNAVRTLPRRAVSGDRAGGVEDRVASAARSSPVPAVAVAVAIPACATGEVPPGIRARRAPKAGDGRRRTSTAIPATRPASSGSSGRDREPPAVVGARVSVAGGVLDSFTGTGMLLSDRRPFPSSP